MENPTLAQRLSYTDSHIDDNNKTFGCLQKFHKFLGRTFRKLGKSVALHPSYYIIIPVFISLLGATGIQRMNYVSDPEYLFSPENGIGKSEREIVESVFPIEYSNNFDPSRITKISPYARVLVSAKDGDTMLRSAVWDELIQLDVSIRNISVEWEDETFTFDYLCCKFDGKCMDNQIFNINELIPELENGSTYLNYPIMLFPLVVPFFYGGPVVNETEGVLLSTKAIALNYWLREDRKLRDRSLEWENKLLSFIQNTKFEEIEVAIFVSRSLEDELEKNAEAIHPYLIVTVLIMIAFSVISVSLSDWVRSKVHLGFIGIVSASLATGCAFGLLMYIGVPFIGINMAAPFLMLGIGLDDMFVILSAWHRTSLQHDVPSRLAETFGEAAVSITITSLTNMLSFFIGAFTPIPSVHIFCLYTGLSVLLTYLWFITFFGGCLALTGYQETKQEHALTCRPVKSKSQATSIGCCYSWFCAGGINPEDPWNPKDNKGQLVMRFFRDYFGRALNIPAIKSLVISVFVLYMCGAIYGCFRITEGLERRRMVLDNSYLIDFFDKEDGLFRTYPYRIQVIINQELNYSDPITKQKLLDLHTKFENLTSIGSRIFSQSWIRSFYRYVDRRSSVRETIHDEKSFIEALKKRYLNPSAVERLDMKFNEDETKIVASRFIIQSYMLKDTTADKEMMLDVRRVADESEFDITVYHPFFVFFDQFLIVRSVSIQTISLAAVAMMVVSLIFIPNPLCSLWVAFSIVSIEIGVIGYMSLWDVNLDSVSMINLIMCIGFSVDFSAHICYSYLAANVNTPSQRVRECLYCLGLPVLQGGASTIIGVLILFFSPSYIFQTFFRIVFLVVFFGMMHSLLLLPVMLSLLGPGSCSPKNKTDLEEVVDAPVLVHERIQMESPHPQTMHIESEREDTDSLERDLGIGSSGSSSRSSLTEAEGVRAHEESNREGTSFRRRTSEGVGNEAFVEDDGDKVERL